MKHLLWVDCLAGALPGVVVLTFHAPLAELYGIPDSLVLVMGAANLMYAAYGFPLARAQQRAPWRVRLLIAANLLWGCVCLGLAVFFAGRASKLGTVLIVGEAAFVAILALLEMRAFGLLTGPQPPR